MRYRPDIDGLRAVAVIPVVLFHAGLSAFSGGYVGVDVFFVISGFLITSIILRDLDRGRFSIVNFYERRLRRIFPALFSVLAATAAAGLMLMLPADLDQLAKSLFAASAFSSNIFFWMEVGYFDGPAELKPLLHTWSLAVEEQFYVVHPLLLLLISKTRRKLYGPCLLVGAAASFALSLWTMDHAASTAFFMAPHRAWELLLGAILAAGMVPEPSSRLVAQAAGWSGLFMIIGSVLGYSPETSFPGLAAVPPALGAALVIYAGQSENGWAQRILSWKPVVFVGLISYSLYLWHWPILAFARYSLPPPISPALMVALVGLSFVLAVASWRYIEAPFRRHGGGLSRARVFQYGALATVLTACAGLLGGLRDGFPGRVDPAVLRLAASSTEPRFNNNCGAVSRQFSNSQLCELGDPSAGEPSFLLWGDSHAQDLLGLVDGLAQRSGRRGLSATLPSCPPLLGVGRLRFPACAGFQPAVLELVRSHPSIQKVILAGRWAYYAEGSRYPLEPGSPSDLTLASALSDSLHPVERNNQELFKQGLDSTLGALRAAGKQPIIIADTPEVSYDVPHRLALAAWYAPQYNIAPTLDQYLQRQSFTLATFRKLAASHGATVVYPHEVFCGDGVCGIQDDQGEPLYQDHNHLSERGAQRLGDSIAAALF